MLRTKFKIWTLKLCLKRTAPTRRTRAAAFSILFLLICSGIAWAQVSPKPTIVMPPTPSTKPLPTTTPPPKARTRPARRVHNERDTPAEKSIRTDAKVNIKLCVAEGRVKINGWNRNEVRAFVSEGTDVGFKVLQKEGKNPVWVRVLGFDPQKNTEAGLDECLSGDEIELDVPRGATIDFIGQESEITIESVNKVVVKNDGGNIALSNIAQGIDARTYEGGVVVENSTGTMKLISTNGNILAFETQPGEVGDSFTAKTSSGAINLQQVEHRQVEANTNSGSIRFSGAFASGGQYAFSTTNGSINLVVPLETSCKINATYAGSFHNEIPLKDVTKTPGSPSTLNGVAGTGDANLNLKTLGGSIRIRKKLD